METNNGKPKSETEERETLIVDFGILQLFEVNLTDREYKEIFAVLKKILEKKYPDKAGRLNYMSLTKKVEDGVFEDFCFRIGESEDAETDDDVL